MPRIYEPVHGIEGVAPSATATAHIPSNRRLHLLKLFASAAGPAVNAAVVDTVTAYVRGKTQRILTGQELLDLAALYGYTLAAADGIPMFFSEPKRASVMDEQVSAWDLWGETMDLKIALKAPLTPVLAIDMAHDDGFTTNQQQQRVRSIVRQLPNFFTGGTSLDIQSLDLAFPIHRLYIYPPAWTTISKVKAIVNHTTTLHELSPASNAAFLKDYGMVAPAPAAGAMYPLIFDVEQQFFNALPPPTALRVTVESDLGGTFKVIQESHAPDYI
jgi:hypothetical protein